MQIFLVSLAALLYIVGTFLPSKRSRAISVAIAAGWVLHGLSLWMEMAVPGSLRIGFAFVLSAALWVSIAIFWVENRNFSLDSLRVLILPCVAVAAILPVIFPGVALSTQDRSPLFSWHIAIAILAYSSLTIAAFHAVLMALQESRLHMRPAGSGQGWLASTLDRLPALLTMEKLLFRMIGVGFILLTLTVLSGIVFSEELFGIPLRWDHKNIFTLLSWALFGILLAGRRWQGWRGKTALSFTLTGFAALLLAYVGSRFVLEVVLHRMGG